jgi:hypothetical protein
MNHAVRVAACTFCLTACNKGPTVDLHNASANQVSSAVQQSGMMTSNSMVEPGLWQSKVTVQEMNIPGMPPEYAAKMKQSVAEQRNQLSRHCITEAEVKKPKEDFFGADKSCHYAHFTMGGGKMDIQMVCKAENMTQTMNVNGSYTPTTYSLDMNSSGSGPQSGMTMKMHVDAERVGECTGKED